MITFTVICFMQTQINNTTAVLYIDETEKNFSNENNAFEYKEWLERIYPNFNTMIYSQTLYSEDELNLNELKISHALSKLSDEEKQLLGLS